MEEREERRKGKKEGGPRAAVLFSMWTSTRTSLKHEAGARYPLICLSTDHL